MKKHEHKPSDKHPKTINSATVHGVYYWRDSCACGFFRLCANVRGQVVKSKWIR